MPMFSLRIPIPTCPTDSTCYNAPLYFDAYFLSPQVKSKIKENYEIIGDGSVGLIEDLSEEYGRSLPDDIEAFANLLGIIDNIYDDPELEQGKRLRNQEARNQFNQAQDDHLQALSVNGVILNSEGTSELSRKKLLSRIFWQIFTSDSAYSISPYTLNWDHRREIPSARFISTLYQAWSEWEGPMNRELNDFVGQYVEITDRISEYHQASVEAGRAYDTEALREILADFEITFTPEMEQMIQAVRENYSTQIDEAVERHRPSVYMYDINVYNAERREEIYQQKVAEKKNRYRKQLEEEHDEYFAQFLRDYILLQNFRARYVRGSG